MFDSFFIGSIHLLVPQRRKYGHLAHAVWLMSSLEQHIVLVYVKATLAQKRQTRANAINFGADT